MGIVNESIIIRLFHFIKAALVPPPKELRRNKGVNYLKRQYLSQYVSAEAEHIGVVVSTAAAGAKDIVAAGGAYPLDLVGRDAHPYAAAADEYPVFGIAFKNFSSYLDSDVRVVHRRGIVGADIIELMSCLGKRFDNRLFQV
jgi:hypothetical protein